MVSTGGSTEKFQAVLHFWTSVTGFFDYEQTCLSNQRIAVDIRESSEEWEIDL